jgi:hypothetical protein
LKENVEQTLHSLYRSVEDYDDLQEELINICVNLLKLETEENIYSKMNIPEIFINVKKSIDYEQFNLLRQKEKIELKLSLIKIESILIKIEKCEKKLSNILSN